MRLTRLALALLAVDCAGLAQFTNSPYTISTFAGIAVPPTPSSPLTAAIGSPAKVIADAAGNVYFAGLNSVFKLDASGVLTRLAGTTHAGYSGDGGAAASAELNNPQGLAVDSGGNLYIADTFNQRIRVVTASGVISTFAGNPASTSLGDGGQAVSALLSAPTGVAVDSAGDLFIAEAVGNRIRRVPSSGVITTVAGTGVAGYSGDGGPATSAQLSGPSGLAVDGAGNLYIADKANNRVRIVSPAGTISTFAGNGVSGYSGDSGPGSAASLNSPSDVVLGAQGALYIADSGNQVVRRVSTGVIATFAGSGAAGYSGDFGQATFAALRAPSGVGADSAGNIYIADFGNYAIRKVTAAGGISTVAGNGSCCIVGSLGDGGQASAAQLAGPFGLALDSSGDVFIGEYGAGRVRIVTPAGVISTYAGVGRLGYSGDAGPATAATLGQVEGLAVDGGGNLYIADKDNARIRMVSPAGIITTFAGTGIAGYSGDGGPAVSAGLNPSGVVSDSAGNVDIADYGNARIRAVSPAGIISTIAGGSSSGFAGDGGPALNAQLLCPSAVARDGAGNIYIADTCNNRVRKISAAGVITTVAGNGVPGYSGDGGPATAAELAQPLGVAVDGAGNLFIADSGNNRVREVSAAGTISTVAGLGSAGYSGDGGPSTLAQLNNPASIIVDTAGNLYVADSDNNAVRMLTPTAAPLAFSTAALPNGTVGAAYSAAFAATGGTAPYAFTTGAMPPGLTLAPTGAVSGTPKAAGTWTVNVSLADATATTVTKAFQIAVTPVPPTITTPQALPGGLAGVPYTQTLAATGGAPPYTWSVTAGALPGGLSLSASGVIAGTPTAAGAYAFTIQVQGNASTVTSATSQSFSLAVIAPVLSRSAVVSQVVAGGGWDTKIWLVNTSSSPVEASLVFHADDGTLMSLPLTVTQLGVAQQVTASTAIFVLGPNTTVLVATGAGTAVMQGWADVLGSNAIGGMAVFHYNGGSEAAIPLQSAIGSSFTLPFDNTGGYTTGVALVNLAATQANFTATVWDESGHQLTTQAITLAKADTAGNGHDAFMLPARLPATAGIRGVVQFKGNPGATFGQVTGLGLRASPTGEFTSLPLMLP